MANSTVVVLDKSTGTVHGLYSDYAFYYQAQLKNTLTIFVNSAGSEYSVQMVHGSRTYTINAPKQETLLENIDGNYLVTNPNTGFFGEKIKIKYTDPTRSDSTVTVEETMPDGSPVANTEGKKRRGRPPKNASAQTGEAPKRRGRPPKNAVPAPEVTSDSLFDDNVFDSEPAAQGDSELSDIVQSAVESEDTRPEPLLDEEVSAEEDSDQDFGDENEDGDASLPLVDVEEPSVTEDDTRHASADQLKTLAKRMHVPLSSGMTVGVLRQKLLSQILV